MNVSGISAVAILKNHVYAQGVMPKQEFSKFMQSSLGEEEQSTAWQPKVLEGNDLLESPSSVSNATRIIRLELDENFFKRSKQKAESAAMAPEPSEKRAPNAYSLKQIDQIFCKIESEMDKIEEPLEKVKKANEEFIKYFGPAYHFAINSNVTHTSDAEMEVAIRSRAIISGEIGRFRVFSDGPEDIIGKQEVARSMEIFREINGYAGMSKTEMKAAIKEKYVVDGTITPRDYMAMNAEMVRAGCEDREIADGKSSHLDSQINLSIDYSLTGGKEFSELSEQEAIACHLAKCKIMNEIMNTPMNLNDINKSYESKVIYLPKLNGEFAEGTDQSISNLIGMLASKNIDVYEKYYGLTKTKIDPNDCTEDEFEVLFAQVLYQRTHSADTENIEQLIAFNEQWQQIRTAAREQYGEEDKLDWIQFSTDFINEKKARGQAGYNAADALLFLESIS